MINRDVPQEVVRRILDHDSPQMTSHYARFHDTTVRDHWEKARKVDIHGQRVRLAPGGPLAEAAWAKHRLSRATQALPNGYCQLPVQQSCPHANFSLTCPMFLTTPDFLDQYHRHRADVLQIISAAEARGQQRLVEMNRQVLTNLDTIITSLAILKIPPAQARPMPADNLHHLALAARRRHELTRAKAIQALRELEAAGTPVTFDSVARHGQISRSWLYTQPDLRTGRTIWINRWTLDRWIADWRKGGFDALVPSPRQSAPRTPPSGGVRAGHRAEEGESRAHGRADPAHPGGPARLGAR